jgi:putative transposase
VPLAIAWEIFNDYLFLLNNHFHIEICSFVLMSNHFHLICRDPSLNLSKGMALFMRETSKEMSRLSGRINRIWGARFHSTVMDSPLYYLHAYKYNYRNPVAAGLSEKVEQYPWSSLQILLGLKHGCIPLQHDDTLFNNVEETLSWLNETYKEQDQQSLKTAFQKKYFKLPNDKNTNYSNRLERWDSISLTLRTQKC